MAQIIDARVKQKTGTAADFAGYQLLAGEIALVRTSASGPVWNFKVGPGNFDSLDWSLQNPGAAQKADTSTVFPSGVPGLYIPTEDGTYEGETVDLSVGYVQLIWDGSDMTKVEFPINLSGITEKDTLIYPNETGYLTNQFLSQGKIYNSETPFKWTGYLPVSNEFPLVFEGFPAEYTAASFFDENKNHISNINISSGTIPPENIPVNAKFVGRNTYYSPSEVELPDVSQTAVIYAKNSLYDSVDKRRSGGIARQEIDNTPDLSHRNEVITLQHDEIIYSTGAYSGDGYAIISPNLSRTRFFDLKQLNRVILRGFSPVFSTKYFYDSNLTPIGSYLVANGVIDFRDFPENAKYMAFTCETSTVKMNGNELLKLVYNGETPDLQFYKKEGPYDIFLGSNSVNGQAITITGDVISSGSSSWSGYLSIRGAKSIHIEGIVPGLNVKAFYDKNMIFLSSIQINNGEISRSLIPDDAYYLGFNTRTSVEGDSRPTAKVTLGFDDLSMPEQKSISLAIPSIVPVVVGLQANLYFDNLRPNPVNDHTELFLMEGPEINKTESNPYIYKTRQTERSIQYSPTIGDENIQITARMRDRDYRVLAERRFQFSSVPVSAGSGQRKVIILAGDSQVDPTYDGAKTSFAPFMKDMFDQEELVDMVFVGQEIMSETVHYDENPSDNRIASCPTEGYGGWRINWFYQNGSPFWNAAAGDVDMIDYMNRMRGLPGNPFGLEPGDRLDYFIFPMGVNDFNDGTSTENIIGRIKTMQDKVWAGYPECVFIIGLTTQGSKFWSMDYRRRWNIEYYNALIREFERPEYAGRVFISAAGLWTDNIYGSRQIRPYREPYKRIVDSKMLLVEKLIQTQGLSRQAAEDLVNIDWGFKVEERVIERWMDEYPDTPDLVHSAWVSAMQQADCYFSTIKYLMS